MPFALLIIGVVLLVAAARGTQGDLFALVLKDFTGPNNFVYWVAAILAIGFLGYIPKLKPISVALLGLVVVVLVLKRGDSSQIGGGFFGQLTEGLASTGNPGGTVASGSPGAAASNPVTKAGTVLGGIADGIIASIPAIPGIH